MSAGDFDESLAATSLAPTYQGASSTNPDPLNASAVALGSATVGSAAGLPRRADRTRRVALAKVIPYLGPAFVVSVAYMDPGNFATNITAGSRFNYQLIWVILWSNVFAIVLQSLSAKLGIVTGKSLPEHCREVFSARVNWFLWVVAVVAAMATDLAEFLGGALGFYLLFGIPVTWGALLTGTISYLILALDKYGQKWVELAISALVSVISISYVVELFLARPEWDRIAYHTLVPLLGKDSVLVAAGMLGATVMPHVIFLHSHLVQSRRSRDAEAIRHHLFAAKVDVSVAMNVAFVINAAMVVVSAATFYARGLEIDSIELAHKTLEPLLGPLSAGAFAVALLASGLSSSAVGTLAGDVIMGGFVKGLTVPTWAKRMATMLPALAIISLGMNPVRVLVLSQVTLSFALPAAIIPLLLITSRRDVMGPFTSSRPVRITGWVIVGLVVLLNAALVVLTLVG